MNEGRVVGNDLKARGGWALSFILSAMAGPWGVLSRGGIRSDLDFKRIPLTLVLRIKCRGTRLEAGRPVRNLPQFFRQEIKGGRSGGGEK